MIRAKMATLGKNIIRCGRLKICKRDRFLQKVTQRDCFVTRQFIEIDTWHLKRTIKEKFNEK